MKVLLTIFTLATIESTVPSMMILAAQIKDSIAGEPPAQIENIGAPALILAIAALVAAIGTAVAAIITARGLRTTANQTLISTKVIEGHVNSERTASEERAKSLVSENKLLRELLNEKVRVAAVLAATRERSRGETAI